MVLGGFPNHSTGGEGYAWNLIEAYADLTREALRGVFADAAPSVTRAAPRQEDSVRRTSSVVNPLLLEAETRARAHSDAKRLAGELPRFGGVVL